MDDMDLISKFFEGYRIGIVIGLRFAIAFILGYIIGKR